MFLEIRDLKKSYGEDSNRVDVLKGINFSVDKGEICVLLGPPVRESLPFLILSAVSTVRIAGIFVLMASGRRI